MFGFIVGGSMGANPSDRPTWFVALVLTPLLAVSVFVWAQRMNASVGRSGSGPILLSL
ncbi:hypothetical protein LK533_08340 [Sphingomonas sp. PL-96]|uniref:hypothetical protein n=1 Tax=Sphingomonas sp. PL-96 TaxID=2887201 RepID=UPI001E540E70|nr:hypothetical protein [Sphingomonas sp. PL-96]MCC2976683.1 hypothetical protein [Sphingomonas sp. PL-96]